MKDYPTLDWTPDRVAKFWDYESRFVDRYFSHNNGDELLRRIQPYLLDRGTLLDYGCGGGVLLGKMLDLGYHVGGLDFSERTVQTIAQRFGPRKNFLGAFLPHQLIAEVRHSDVVCDPLFDAILVIEVLEHLDDESLSQTLETIKHGVAPDGIVIFTTPNEEDLEALRVLCPCCEHVFHRWQHVRSWSKKSLCTYIEAHGFQIVDAFTTNFKRKKWQRWKNMTASWKQCLSPLNPRLASPPLRKQVAPTSFARSATTLPPLPSALPPTIYTQALYVLCVQVIAASRGLTGQI